MAHLPNDSEEEYERLRMENEMKKAKMLLEYGAHFPELPGEKSLDPAIEKEFLDNIEQFEKNYLEAERIKVYDLIKRPAYRPEKEIPDSLISKELERLSTIMNKNGIQLDSLCKVEERELYRFITEELFLHEMDNMKIPGMMWYFIYEEFHPNHDYDIRRTTAKGIKAFLNKKDEYYQMHFIKEAFEEPGLMSFRDAFGSFSLRRFKITDLSIRGINASVDFNIDFSGTIVGSKEKQHFAGHGSVELLYQYDYWYIQMVYFPAISNHR